MDLFPVLGEKPVGVSERDPSARKSPARYQVSETRIPVTKLWSERFVNTEQVTKNTHGNETECEHGASVHAYICKRDQHGAKEVVTVGWLGIRLGWTALVAPDCRRWNLGPPQAGWLCRSDY